MDAAFDLPALPPRQNLREKVGTELRAALITGRLRPGVIYSAPKLAQTFGVSPTPVREAMLDLAKEGLVEAVRNKGFRVVDIDERELDECTALRRLIEPPTVAAITGTAAGAELEALRPLAELIVTAAVERDLTGYIDADHRFHSALLALSGNRRLVSVVADLRYRSRLYGVPALAAADRLLPSAHEHVELLDLMLAGDAEGAEALMHRHLDHVRTIWAAAPAD
ncbi:GntR family transcriptional regulator [Phytomonospora endophytica]|uniref:DNA-binding GntR family transcriptional regulator n=1 Tax=Phytomonospora endophytica TaxID=714109 RepID=A0A841FV32_9ACTN|nr:GntR family transcriptional regulator [Phytomonospora endophytica]MBB6035840.1 DNA-binding GntR family transcriptional regulator [Phytomonospora endophytica]GIG71519.1 GntR family transcriptional regulator [Phytomonospora endophytica]